MGMVLGLNTLSDENIEKLLSDPPLVWKVLAPDDPEIYEEERKSKTSIGFLTKLFKRKKDVEQTKFEDTSIELGENEGADTDLDKAWHGIHYLLTGSVWEGDEPQNFLLAGGETIGEIDVGYGPARCIKSDDVRKIFDHLSGITVEELKSRFDPDKMMANQIYPEIWDREEDDGNLDYLIEYFEELKHFISKAVEFNLGIIVSIS